jgi:predicted SprT family Zn-dependent metalloprotease
MRDLRSFANKALKMVEDANIEYGYIDGFEANNRLKTCWGECKRRSADWWYKTDYFIIQINAMLLRDDVPEVSLIQTLIHEILHTCENCFNHGKQWKRYADIINTKYNLNVSRLNSQQSLGLSEIMPIKHKFICNNCGTVVTRTRDSKFTQHYSKYICKRCGGKFTKEF